MKKVSLKAFRSSEQKTVCPCARAKTYKKRDIFSPRLQGGAAADAHHSTRRARTRGPSARAHELAKDTAPSEPAPSGRAPRLDPTGTRPIRAFHLVVCQCLGATPECECTFSEHRPALGARARADARSRSARGRVRVRAHLPALPAGRGEGIAANPRPRRGASARAIERALFPAFFSARFKRPVGGPDGVLTESSPSRARAPCHAIPRLALARFQTRIVVASARAGWPRARDTRLPRRAPPPIFRARAKRTRRARPRKPPP